MIVKEDEMKGECSTNGEKMIAYRLLMGKPRGDRSLGRSRHRWVDYIKMELGALSVGGGGDIDWIGLALDREKWRALVNVVLNLKFV
jgi:hypothetical protein